MNLPSRLSIQDEQESTCILFRIQADIRNSSKPSKRRYYLFKGKISVEFQANQCYISKIPHRLSKFSGFE